MAYSEKVVESFQQSPQYKQLQEGRKTGWVRHRRRPGVRGRRNSKSKFKTTHVDAKFKTFGCGSAILVPALATEWLKGKTVEEAAKSKNTDIVREPAPGEDSIVGLIEDAIMALADYQKESRLAKQPTAERTGDVTNECTMPKPPGLRWSDAAPAEKRCCLINVQRTEEGGLRLGVAAVAAVRTELHHQLRRKIGQATRYEFDGGPAIVDAKSDLSARD